jgi:hypothetical protein
VLGVYVFSYWMLSIRGRFEIEAVGMKGPKGWIWAPAGYPDFPTSGDITWQRLYHPLWVMDCQFWHNDKKTGHPGYPIRKWDEAAISPGYRLVNP